MSITCFRLRFLCDCEFVKGAVEKEKETSMNCNMASRRGYLEAKIRGWSELANCGVDRFEQARGRRNLRRLVGAHPQMAAECGVGQPANGMCGRAKARVPGLEV